MWLILREMFNDYYISSLYSYEGSFLGFGIDEKAQGVLHSILTVPFTVSKMLANMVDSAIEQLYSLNLLTESVDSILSTAQSIWDKFFDLFGVLCFVLVLVHVIKDYYAKGLGRAFIRLVIFFGIFALGNGFFSNGSQWVKDFNAVSGQLQSDLTEVVAPDISDLNNSLYAEFGGEEKQNSIDSIRNSFYTMTVLKPWALINFGTTDVSAETYKDFLVLKGENKKDKIKKIKEKVKTESEENYYLTSDSFHEKFFIGLTALVNVLVLGTVVLVISILNPLLQLCALLLILVFPILLGVSLLPDKEGVGQNAGLLFVSIFFLKGLLGLGFGMVFLLFDIIDRFFGGANLDSFLLSFVLKAGLIILAWKKRNVVKNLASGNRVRRQDLWSSRDMRSVTKGTKAGRDLLKNGRKKYRDRSDGLEELPEQLDTKGAVQYNGHASFSNGGEEAILRSTVDDLSNNQNYYSDKFDVQGDTESDSSEWTTDAEEEMKPDAPQSPYSSIPAHFMTGEDEEEIKQRLANQSANPYATVMMEEDEETIKKTIRQETTVETTPPDFKEEEFMIYENDLAINTTITPELHLVDDDYFASLERELSDLRGDEEMSERYA